MLGTSKQQLALKYLTDNITKIIIYGGAAGGGKSILGCFWLLVMALNYPGTRWFIGRAELKRITQSTLISWHKVCRMLGVQFDRDYKINWKYNYIQLKNGSRIELLDLQKKPSDELYERFGSVEYTGGWIEEAGEVDVGAFDVLQTRVGRHLNAELNLKPKILVTCNPKKNWLYYRYYKRSRATPPDEVLEAYEVFIQAFVTDNPHLTQDYLDSLRNTKDKAMRERLLHGNWEYDDDPATLIQYESILNLWNNTHVPSGQRYLTCDVARYGRDTTTIGIWSGWRLVALYKYEKLNTKQVAEKINAFRSKLQIPAFNCVIDEDGVGGGVVDQVPGSVGFINNARPVIIRDEQSGKPAAFDAHGQSTEENFDNLKSQCYFYLANDINEGKVFIGCDLPAKMKEQLIEELEQVKQKDVDNDKKKGVVPKDEVKAILGRSPDLSDNMMMRKYLDIRPKPQRIQMQITR